MHHQHGCCQLADSARGPDPPLQVGLERSQQVLGALQSLGVAGKDIMRAKRLDALNQAGYVNVQWSLDVSSVTDLQVTLYALAWSEAPLCQLKMKYWP
jgi:hypothetical protein